VSENKPDIRSYYINKSNKQKKYLEDNIKPIKIAMYRRVSTQEQANDGQSLEAQKDRIDKFLSFDSTFEGKEIEIEDFCDKGFSGKDLNRPAIKKLLPKIKRREIDYLIVIKLDRLSRHLPEMYNFMELFNKLDIGFISINEKIDTKTAHGRFFIGILASLSQLEREQTAERVQGVFKELVTKQPLGGKAPFGYFYYKPDPNSAGIYLPYDKIEAKKIKLPPLKILDIENHIYPAKYVPLMFDWYSKLRNFRKIAIMLTERKIPTANQIYTSVKYFFNRSENEQTDLSFIVIHKPKNWNPRSVKDILTNPFYTGTRVWNRKDNLNKKIRKYEDWIYVENTHKRLIKLETFQKVENLIHH